MKSLLFIFSLLILVSCQNNESEIVIEDSTDSSQNIPVDNYIVPVWTPEELLCLINESGDTVIPFHHYSLCYTDTIRELGVVQDNEEKIWGINMLGIILFEVHPIFEEYDFIPRPDNISEGLFRIIKNEKIGFANEKGKIMIEPIYDCAYPFIDGSAKVSLNKALIDIENSEFNPNYSCTNWFYINHQGLRVKP